MIQLKAYLANFSGSPMSQYHYTEGIVMASIHCAGRLDCHNIQKNGETGVFSKVDSYP
jgi:hypothetical protein